MLRSEQKSCTLLIAKNLFLSETAMVLRDKSGSAGDKSNYGKPCVGSIRLLACRNDLQPQLAEDVAASGSRRYTLNLFSQPNNCKIIFYAFVQKRFCIPQRNAVRTLSTTRDGRWLLTADFEQDCVTVVWDTEKGQVFAWRLLYGTILYARKISHVSSTLTEFPFVLYSIRMKMRA